MSDLISRRSALEALTVTEEMDTAELLWLLTTRINDLPTIEAEPIRHGRWIDGADGSAFCSECGTEWLSDSVKYYKFCPICGAKMKGADDE